LINNFFTKSINKITNKSIILPEFYSIDLHSHLIPGIDDGSLNMEQSIQMVKTLKEMGFKRLITTPHIMSHKFPNNKDIILRGLDSLKNELLSNNIDIPIQAAAEYYYDEHFIELIERKDLLTFGDNYVLFELSYTTPVFGLEQVVYKLLSAGYKPILAHPERYSYFNSNLEKYHQLKDMGLLFQLNVNSLNNFYGKKVKIAAKYLINKGLVDFVGSDTHRPNYLESLQKSLSIKEFKSIENKNRILNNYL